MAVVAAAGLVALTGCSGSGGGDALSTANEAADAPAAAPLERGSATDTSGGDATAKPGANRPAIRTQAVINTGRATLVSDNLDQVRDDLDRLVQRYGGFVASEQTSNDGRGRIQSATIQIRVPAGDFMTVVRALDDIADVKHVETTSEDVTTQVIDVDARVRTMRVSLTQLRKLLRQTTDIGTMLQIESDIARREAELESTLAQQRYLSDQTAMSTLDLYLTLPAKHVAPPGQDDDSGFLAGLRNGWDALAGSTVVLLTIIGAVLPFAVVLGVIGVPAWVLTRRLRERSARERSQSAA
jgi:hypothetical protein